MVSASGSENLLLQTAARVDHALRFALRARPKMLTDAETSGFNEFHLVAGDVDTLDQIATTGESTMSAIAAGLRVDPSTATRAVERLARKGLVERRTDPDDARVTLVSFTDRGKVVLGEARARRTALACRILERLGPEDQATIGRLWPDLADAIIEELASPEGQLPVGSER